MHSVVYERDPNDVKIAYICDRQQCEKCSYPLCSHTTDIAHAVNFKNLADGGDFMYMEKDCEINDSNKQQKKIGPRFNEVYMYMKNGRLPPLKEE